MTHMSPYVFRCLEVRVSEVDSSEEALTEDDCVCEEDELPFFIRHRASISWPLFQIWFRSDPPIRALGGELVMQWTHRGSWIPSDHSDPRSCSVVTFYVGSAGCDMITSLLPYRDVVCVVTSSQMTGVCWPCTLPRAWRCWSGKKDGKSPLLSMSWCRWSQL